MYELCYKSKSGRNASRCQFRCCEILLILYSISRWPSLFFKFLESLSPFLCHFVTYNRDYYEWLCRLRRHSQVGRLPIQGTWLGLVAESVIWESVWHYYLQIKLVIIHWQSVSGEDVSFLVVQVWPYHIQIGDQTLTLYYWLKSLNMPSLN